MYMDGYGNDYGMGLEPGTFADMATRMATRVIETAQQQQAAPTLRQAPTRIAAPTFTGTTTRDVPTTQIVPKQQPWDQPAGGIRLPTRLPRRRTVTRRPGQQIFPKDVSTTNGDRLTTPREAFDRAVDSVTTLPAAGVLAPRGLAPTIQPLSVSVTGAGAPPTAQDKATQTAKMLTLATAGIGLLLALMRR